MTFDIVSSLNHFCLLHEIFNVEQTGNRTANKKCRGIKNNFFQIALVVFATSNVVVEASEARGLQSIDAFCADQASPVDDLADIVDDLLRTKSVRKIKGVFSLDCFSEQRSSHILIVTKNCYLNITTLT